MCDFGDESRSKPSPIGRGEALKQMEREHGIRAREFIDKTGKRRVEVSSSSMKPIPGGNTPVDPSWAQLYNAPPAYQMHQEYGHLYLDKFREFEKKEAKDKPDEPKKDDDSTSQTCDWKPIEFDDDETTSDFYFFNSSPENELYFQAQGGGGGIKRKSGEKAESLPQEDLSENALSLDPITLKEDLLVEDDSSGYIQSKYSSEPESGTASTSFSEQPSEEAVSVSQEKSNKDLELAQIKQKAESLLTQLKISQKVSVSQSGSKVSSHSQSSSCAFKDDSNENLNFPSKYKEKKSYAQAILGNDSEKPSTEYAGNETEYGISSCGVSDIEGQSYPTNVAKVKGIEAKEYLSSGYKFTGDEPEFKPLSNFKTSDQRDKLNKNTATSTTKIASYQFTGDEAEFKPDVSAHNLSSEIIYNSYGSDPRLRPQVAPQIYPSFSPTVNVLPSSIITNCTCTHGTVLHINPSVGLYEIYARPAGGSLVLLGYSDCAIQNFTS